MLPTGESETVNVEAILVVEDNADDVGLPRNVRLPLPKG
jgi:hypothetical protein